MKPKTLSTTFETFQNRLETIKHMSNISLYSRSYYLMYFPLNFPTENKQLSVFQLGFDFKFFSNVISSYFEKSHSQNDSRHKANTCIYLGERRKNCGKLFFSMLP